MFSWRRLTCTSNNDIKSGGVRVCVCFSTWMKMLKTLITLTQEWVKGLCLYASSGNWCVEKRSMCLPFTRNYLKSIMHYTIKTTTIIGKYQLSCIKVKPSQSGRLAQVTTVQQVCFRTIHIILLHRLTNLKQKQSLWLFKRMPTSDFVSLSCKWNVNIVHIWNLQSRIQKKDWVYLNIFPILSRWANIAGCRTHFAAYRGPLVCSGTSWYSIRTC